MALWIRVSRVTALAIAAVIAFCPSGCGSLGEPNGIIEEGDGQDRGTFVTGLGTYVGKMFITYYHLAEEATYANYVADTNMLNDECQVIKKVPSKFVAAVKLEGTGVLLDGRIISIDWQGCDCGVT